MLEYIYSNVYRGDTFLTISSDGILYSNVKRIMKGVKQAIHYDNTYTIILDVDNHIWLLGGTHIVPIPIVTPYKFAHIAASHYSSLYGITAEGELYVQVETRTMIKISPFAVVVVKIVVCKWDSVLLDNKGRLYRVVKDLGIEEVCEGTYFRDIEVVEEDILLTTMTDEVHTYK